MKNIMVDLETLGNGSDAVILSIGAVEFDAGGIGEQFYEVVNPQSCIEVGMTVDVSTVQWWMKQSDAARAAVCSEGSSIENALHRLSTFVRRVAPNGKVEVWGNGATFDNVILSNAYRLTKAERPWPFWADRCHRTLKNLYPSIKAPAPAVAHNALEDAKAQALHAAAILAHINGATWEPSAAPQGGTA